MSDDTIEVLDAEEFQHEWQQRSGRQTAAVATTQLIRRTPSQRMQRAEHHVDERSAMFGAIARPLIFAALEALLGMDEVVDVVSPPRRRIRRK